MPQLTGERLRRWAAELDDEERAEKESATQERIDRLEAASSRGGLTEEQAETLKRARALLDALDEEDRRAAAKDTGDDGEGDDDAGGSDDPPATRRTGTRKGRKRGNAYDYDVDEKTGRPVPLGVAKVYQGDDEPDQVEFEIVDDDGGE